MNHSSTRRRWTQAPSQWRSWTALLKALSNKTAGVDDIPTEQWLTADNRKKLLDILKQALTAGHIPQEWRQALVVEIYKGKANNYRPISLLSTAYKLMARILQQRLEKAIDHRLRDTQFGFRAGRSTSQPVHILRRLLEKAERTDDSLYVLVLDWRQAFDKVNIEALEVAMQRMGVPQPMVSFISHIYSSQLFQVKAAGHTSDILAAASGIRHSQRREA